MSIEQTEYAQDIEIDPTQLDVEWLRQPNLMLKYTALLASAKKAVDLAKEKLDIYEAILSAKIRRRPAVYGIEKETEKAINIAIVKDDKHKTYVKKLHDAKHEAELLVGVVRAFEQRKKALENLVVLNGQNYFSGPKEPRDLAGEWDKTARQNVARGKVKKKLSRRRSK